MTIAIWKKSAIDKVPLYIIVTDTKGFYIIPHSKKRELGTQEVGSSFGVFSKYTLLEVGFLKLLGMDTEGYNETSWLDLLVVLGAAKEDIEESIRKMGQVGPEDIYENTEDVDV